MYTEITLNHHTDICSIAANLPLPDTRHNVILKLDEILQTIYSPNKRM